MRFGARLTGQRTMIEGRGELIERSKLGASELRTWYEAQARAASLCLALARLKRERVNHPKTRSAIYPAGDKSVMLCKTSASARESLKVSIASSRSRCRS